jgi:hypothetical protein
MKFDVLSEPWIPARAKDGSIQQYGIRELLCKSPELLEITDESPMNEFGMYRLLFTLLMDALDLQYREDLEDLLEDGVFLPHVKRIPSEQTMRAKLNLNAADRQTLFNGIERPRKQADENSITQRVGDSLCFFFDAPEQIGRLRLRFDPDYSRLSISDNLKMRVFAMKLHTGKDFAPVRVANTIVKSFAVYADGEEIYRIEDNYLSLVKIPVNRRVKELCVKWLATNGAEQVRLFAVDLIE